MLTTDTNVARYTISPSVTDYTFDFPFWDFSEISVEVVDDETGDSYELKRDIDYSLTVSEPIADPVYEDGTISMISDKYKDYTSLIITRLLPLDQDTHYPNSEPINGEVLERTFDKTIAKIQQLQEDLNHTLRLPNTEDPEDIVMPEAADRKDKVLGFGEDGVEVKMYANPDKAIEVTTQAAQQAAQTLIQIAAIGRQVAADAQAAAEAAQTAQSTVHPGYRVTLGDGVSKTFTITHNLNADWTIPVVAYTDPTLYGYDYEAHDVDKNHLYIEFSDVLPVNGAEIRIVSGQRVEVVDLPDNIQIHARNIADDSILTEEDIQQIIGIIESRVAARMLAEQQSQQGGNA